VHWMNRTPRRVDAYQTSSPKNFFFASNGPATKTTLPNFSLGFH
jgi:hypothetical protein